MKTRCMGCMREQSEMGACLYCGFDRRTYQPSLHHLPPETVLDGKYMVGRVIGEGGFGITYVGWDLNLEMKVAIKEYYPNGLVTRGTGCSYSLSVLSGDRTEAFRKGRGAFMEEARRLAKLWGLPGIIGVRDFFPENNTAYLVMEYAEGQTLRDVLKQQPGERLPVDTVLAMMEPVLESLKLVHEAGLIHRDISPSNLMIGPDGKGKLLDFGASRDYSDDGGKSLSVVLKPGYSPEEQYRSHGIQGPWTDIYAICATIYRAITGVIPPEVLERQMEDTLVPPSGLGVSIQPKQEAALMQGLAVSGQDRPQSVGELQSALRGENRPGKNGKKKWLWVCLPAGTSAVLLLAVFLLRGWILDTLGASQTGNSRIEVGVDLNSSSGIRTTEADSGLSSAAESAETELLTIEELLGTDADASSVTEVLNEKVEMCVENAKAAEKAAETAETKANYAAKQAESCAEEAGEDSAITYINGDCYTGELKNGLREGYGVCVMADGSSYAGEWSDDMRNGYGILTYTNGTVYAGEWKDDVRSGYGVRSFSTGGYYTGEWQNDMREGYGVRYYNEEDGGSYVGLYRDNIRSGYGARYYKNETEYLGEWQNDVREGCGIYHDSDGTSVLGIWEGDVFQEEYPVSYQTFSGRQDNLCGNTFCRGVSYDKPESVS